MRGAPTPLTHPKVGGHKLRKATTVKPLMWQKPGFLRLSSDCRLVYAFLITGPDSNLTGIVRYPIGMVSMCTGLPPRSCEVALGDLAKAGRIACDADAGIIFIIRWLKHNPLNSPKLVAGYLKYLEAFDGHPFAASAVRLLRSPDYDTVSIEYRQGIDTLQGQGQGIPTLVPDGSMFQELGSGATSEVASPAFAMMPCKEADEPITEADVAHWESLYGRIDVRRTLTKMVGYWAALPRNRRKTRTGIRKSINSWLAKDDDKAPVETHYREMPEV